MDFIFEQIRIGGDRNFGYLVGDRRAQAAVLIDPAYTPEALVERATLQGLKVTHILNTHGHDDHTNGNATAQKLTGAPVAAFKDSPIFPDVRLDDNATLAVGGYSLRFLHTPGHCDDHLVIQIREAAVAITGDLLFAGKVGGTTSDDAARVEWQSLQRILAELPGETSVWPGHDYGCRPASTIALEKLANPFLRCKDVEEFIRFKRGWAEFKVQHGLK